MILMKLQCAHNCLANMLIMETLFVMTAVTMAIAAPSCSEYCDSLSFSKTTRPFDCDCRSLQKEEYLPHRIKRQDQAIPFTLAQKSFPSQFLKKLYYIQKTRSNTYHTTENEVVNDNFIKEKDSKVEPDKIYGYMNRIDTKTLSECVFLQLILSYRICNNTGFKVNLQTDEDDDYKLISDSALMATINKKWNATLNDINNNINLTKDHFEQVTFSVNSRSMFIKDMDSIFLKGKRISHTQLPASTAILSNEYSSKSRTIVSATVNIKTLSDGMNDNTQLPKKQATEMILTPKDVTETIDLVQNATSKAEYKNNIETSSLNPLLPLNSTTMDNTNLNDQKSSDTNENTVLQVANKTESIKETVKNQSFADLPKDYNMTTERINEKQYNTSVTRNNQTSETSAEDTHVATSTIKPITVKNIMSQARANLSKSYLNNGTLFRKHYEESELPIIRILSREYPNGTVSSIINGTEILPNNDFREGSISNEFKSPSAQVYKIYHIAVPINTQKDSTGEKM